MADEINSLAIRINTSDVDGAVNSLDALASRGPKVERAVEQVNQASQRAGKSLATLGRGAGAGLAEVERGSEQAARGLNLTFDSALSLANGLKGIATTGLQAFLGNELVQAAGRATAAMLEASVAGERLALSLNFSSNGQSAREIQYLREITGQLGLQFSSTADAYAKFQAAANGTSIAGQQAQKIFESVAKASAVLGLSASDTSGVLLALQQMVSKGVVQAEELRGQLGERLPGAFQLAAKAMGVTTAELGKMLEQGEVVADEFLPKFARQLELTYGEAAEKSANRLGAATTRLADSWERLKQAMGDSGVSRGVANQYEILGDGINGVAEAMENARRRGEGLYGQITAGQYAILRFLNPLQAFGYEAISAGNALAEAQKKLDDLQKQGAATSENIYLRSSYFQAAALVEQLKAAREEQAKLAGKDPRDQSAFPSRSQSYEKEAQRIAGIQASMDKVLVSLSGVKENFFKDLNALKAGLDAGLIDETRYAEAVNKLIMESGGGKTPRRAAERKANDEAAQSLARYVEGLQRQLTTVEDLTEKQKALDLLKSLGATGEVEQVRELVLGLAQKVTIAKQDEALTRSRLKDQEEEAKRLKDLNEELDRLSGRSDSDRRNELNNQLKNRLDSGETFSAEELDKVRKGIDAIGKSVKDASTEVDEFTKQAARNIQDAFSDTILKTVQGDFKNIGQLWLQLLQRMAAQALAANLGKLILGDYTKTGEVGGWAAQGLDWLGKMAVPESSYWKDGGAFDKSGSVRMFANGDVFDSPTAFRYGRDSIGVMGEAGPEAVMPLQRGKNGRLGVSMLGGGGDTYNFNVAPGVTRNELLATLHSFKKQMEAETASKQRRASIVGA